MEEGSGSRLSWGGDRTRDGDLSRGATEGDGFVSQLCTLLNVEATGVGDRPGTAGKVSLNPKANHDMLVFPSKINERVKTSASFVSSRKRNSRATIPSSIPIHVHI